MRATTKGFEPSCDRQATVVYLGRQQWGDRGYLLVAMDRRGVWHNLVSDGHPGISGLGGTERSHWHHDRAAALAALGELRRPGTMPPDVALTGMVELAEGLVVALERT